MIRNYIKVAFRNLSKNKTYVVINTFGMGIAMACCLTAYLLVAYNIEFDDYFKDEQVQHVVKVMNHFVQPDGKQYKELVAPILMGPAASEELAGIETFTRYCNQNGSLSFMDQAFYENIRFADAPFFDIFKLDLKSGSYKNFGSEKSIFISEELAKKYFADDDPLGRNMSVELKNKKYDVVVGGVFDKIPLNSSFNIGALMRIEVFMDVHEIGPNDWANYDATLLLKLTDNQQLQTIAEQLKKYGAKRNEVRKESTTTSFELLPFRETVVRDEIRQSDLRHPIPFVALLIFSTLGFIILLIACFNLTNTTIALTASRIKEIGVRKVVGSSRSQITYQFLLEMVITLSFASVAGLLMAQIIVPKFAEMWQLQYGLGDLNGTNFIIGLLMLIFVSAILAGLYPALSSSRFRPVMLLKGGMKIKGTNSLTMSLLIAQFSLSVIVLIAGIIFIQNEGYQQALGLGYDKDKVLTVSIEGQQEYNRLKNLLETHPSIEVISGAKNHIGPYSSYHATIKLDTATFKTRAYEVGAHYFDVLGMGIVSGRDFIEDNETDFASAAIVDENFVALHGLTDPIETRITYNEQLYRVIGVVKNHLSGLKEKINTDHFFTMVKPTEYQTMVIRTDSKTILETQAYVEEQWKKISPGKPFQSKLQGDIIFNEANGYNTNLSQIFLFLTILGCLLSASGIYSLARLNVQKRTKEIGVRKVLGASVTSVIQLVNREFVAVLLLAMTVGGAGGFFLTDALLDNLYVQHIEVGITPVVLCGMLIFLIGISTTSGTIFKAAQANPTESLRSE